MKIMKFILNALFLHVVMGGGICQKTVTLILHTPGYNSTKQKFQKMKRKKKNT